MPEILIGINMHILQYDIYKLVKKNSLQARNLDNLRQPSINTRSETAFSNPWLIIVVLKVRLAFLIRKPGI